MIFNKLNTERPYSLIKILETLHLLKCGECEQKTPAKIDLRAYVQKLKPG